MRTLCLVWLLLCSCALWAQEGAPDSSFGVYGRIIPSPLQSSLSANSVCYLGSDRFLSIRIDIAAGRIKIARRNSSWETDATYPSGELLFPSNILVTGSAFFVGIPGLPQTLVGRCVAQDPVSGTLRNALYLIRFTRYGVVDSHFGQMGIVVTEAPWQELTAMVGAGTSDGSIVLADQRYLSTGNPELMVWRYRPDGSLDSAFGSQGFFRMELPFNGFFVPNDLVVDAASRILLAGEKTEQGYGHAVLMRLNSRGQLDSSFDQDGLLSLHLPLTNISTARLLRLRADGKILAFLENFGNALDTARISLVQISANGQLDSSFGQNGLAMLPFVGLVFDATQDSEGRMLVLAGKSVASYKYLLMATRLLSGGNIDAGYGRDGFGVTMLPDTVNGGHNFLLPDGKVLLTAQRYTDFVLWRLQGKGRPSGRSVSLYPNPGVSPTLSFRGFNENVQVLVHTIDGRMVQAPRQLSLAGDTFYTIPENGLPSAVYLVSVLTTNGWWTCRWVKP